MDPISHDRLAGISAFVAAAEAGSFAQAAMRLGQTRSAVAKAVARLETRLGTRLFARTTRSLVLTEDGHLFHERCAQAIADLDAAQHQLEIGRNEASGRLRISAPVVLGRHHVAPVLLALAARHPHLRVEGNFTDRRVDFLDDGVDLAIRSGTLADSDELVARLLGHQPMILVAAPAYLQRHGCPRQASDLLLHRRIGYVQSGRTLGWGLQPGDVGLAPHVGLDDLDAIATAALSSAGLAQLPLWRTQDDLQAGRLVQVLPELVGPRFPLHLVWPRTRFLPYRVRIAIDALLEALPPVLASAHPTGRSDAAIAVA